MFRSSSGIPSFKATFLKPVHAQKAAQLLGVAPEELQKTIFASQHPEQTERRPSTSSSGRKNDNEKLTRKHIGPTRLSLDKISITDRPGDGQEALEAFLVGLYRELFNAVVCLINK